MKQHININQLNELTKKQQHKLIKWYDERDKSCSGHLEYTLFGRIAIPLMSIGQMIEFLEDEYSFEEITIHKKYDEAAGIGDFGYEGSPDEWNIEINKIDEWSRELCDVLWLAVKKVLER